MKAALFLSCRFVYALAMATEHFSTKGVRLRDPEDVSTLRQDILDGVREEMAASFPKSYGGVRLEVKDVDYEGPDKWGYADQDKALMEDKFLARKLRGTLRLVDEKTGELIDERRQSLMRVPWMTERGTFVHGGNEYVTAMQGRLVPGPYTRKTNNGQLETHFNPKPGSGRSFRVLFDPESAQYRLGVKTSQLHLYSLLKDIGVPDDALKTQWGSEVFQNNSAKYDRRVLPRAYTQLVPAWKQVQGATTEQMAAAVKDAFQQTQVNANVAHRTLPNWFDRTKAAEWRASALGRMIGQDALEKRANVLDFSPDWAPQELQHLRVQDHIEERAQLSLTLSSVLTQFGSSPMSKAAKLRPILERLDRLALRRGECRDCQNVLGEELAGKELRCDNCKDTTKSARLFLADEMRLWSHLYDEQDPDYEKYRKKLLKANLSTEETEEAIDRFRQARAKAQTQPDGKVWNERRLAARAWTKEPDNQAQAEAGNYAKGTFSLRGLQITIETGAGMYRKGWDENGKVTWSIRMQDDYGYVLGTKSERDGDHIDVFLGPDLSADVVYCVDQIDQKSGDFDEHKFVLGASSADEAREIYLRNYEDRWKVGKVTPLTWPQFKHWVAEGDSDKSLWDTDTIELPQKRASADPYYDWDGTLIPRIGGPAGTYLAALKELTELTPTGETLKGKIPVDLITARPPLFHPAIRETASRLGLDIGEILHASGPKSEILGPTGRDLIDDDDEVIQEVNDALGQRATKVASEFEPDLDDEAMQEAYDAIYGKSKPQLAGMNAWPKEWMPPGSDPLGWVNWYKGHLAGTKTDDDDRQIRRWKQFKARHGSQFQRNPTPRRGYALRYWAIDPLKLLPEDKREAFAEEMAAYKAKRTSSWMREKTAEFALPDLQQLASFLNQHHSAGIVVDGTQDQIEQQILRFLGGSDPEASAMLSAAKALRGIDMSQAQEAPDTVKTAGSAPKGCLMAMLSPLDVVRIVKWIQENVSETHLVGSGIERDSHVTVLYGYDADVTHKEVAKQLPDEAVTFRLGKIKRFPANEHRLDSDVLVVEVESEDLQALNASMRKAFEGRYTNSYPTYTPHLTLAYVKPGASKKLDGHARFDGEVYVCNALQYSTPKAKSRHTLKLK